MSDLISSTKELFKSHQHNQLFFFYFSFLLREANRLAILAGEAILGLLILSL